MRCECEADFQFVNIVLQQTKSHTAELRAKPEYHKFLIGKGGGNIRKVRDSTGARIIFPTADDKDQELITVVGTEEAVREAQKELEELIKSLVRLRVSSEHTSMSYAEALVL